jgi:hypothetical protein
MENQEKYKKEKVTIDIIFANIFAFLLLIPTILLFGLPYYLIWQHDIQFKDLSLHSFIENYWIMLLASIFVFIIGTVAHELIHGVVWACYAKSGLKSIKFGVIWKMITPYCHCKEPLKLKQYIIGAIMPAIILGFIPAILALVVGNIALLIFGVFFIIAAGGDFLMIHALRKEKKNTLVEDHPSEAGCYVYRFVEQI